MPSLSPLRASLRPSVFADLEVYVARHVARGADLIALHRGDTYLEPPRVAQIGGPVAQGDDDDLYSYGPAGGLASLRNVIAEELRRRGRAFPSVSGDRNILLGVGATHALFCSAASILSPADDVLLAAPYWPLAHGILTAAGARPIEVSFTSRLYDHPALDAGALLRAGLTSATKAIYLSSPNNPDGKMLSRGQLESIAAIAIEHDLWVFADETYADFSFGAPHISLSSLPGMAERTITAYSFSKSHALAGLRVGYAVAPREVVALAQRVAAHSVFNVPVVTQHAVAAAIAAGPRWTDRALRVSRRALDAVVEGLRDTRIRFAMPDGGAYVFLDFHEVLGDRPLTLLLERAVERGVLLAPGASFGTEFPQHARLCFTSEPLPRLVEGITRLLAAVDDLG